MKKDPDFILFRQNGITTNSDLDGAILNKERATTIAEENKNPALKLGPILSSLTLWSR
jgi:hypothetical protein